MLILLMAMNPYSFVVQGEKMKFLLIFNVFILTVFFPMFSIFMMKMLDFIKSYEMKDKSERIAPLVTTGVFYLWLFINLKDNSNIPVALTFFILGSTIGLFLALMLNSFTKISLHTVGMGGLLAGMCFIRYFFVYESFFLELPFGTYQISSNLVLIIIMIIAGLVGTSRLLLKAHDEFDVYGGYIVGVFSMIVAFRIMI